MKIKLIEEENNNMQANENSYDSDVPAWFAEATGVKYREDISMYDDDLIDFIEGSIMSDVCSKLNDDYGIFEEPSAQGGVGTDYFFMDGKIVATMDIQDEQSLAFSICLESASREEAVNKITKWLVEYCIE